MHAGRVWGTGEKLHSYTGLLPYLPSLFPQFSLSPPHPEDHRGGAACNPAQGPGSALEGGFMPLHTSARGATWAAGAGAGAGAGTAVKSLPDSQWLARDLVGSIKQGLSCSGGSVCGSLVGAGEGAGHARASPPVPVSRSHSPGLPREEGAARAQKIAGDSARVCGHGAGAQHRGRPGGTAAERAEDGEDGRVYAPRRGGGVQHAAGTVAAGGGGRGGGRGGADSGQASTRLASGYSSQTAAGVGGCEARGPGRSFPQFAGDFAPPLAHPPCEGRAGRVQASREAAGGHQFDFDVTYSL